MTAGVPVFDRRAFDHVGIPTDEAKEGAVWLEADGVWVTNPREHKYRIEYLRFEPDTPVLWEVSHLPHIAYKVRSEDFDQLVQASQIVIPPFEPNPNMKIAYVKKNGALVEYIVYRGQRRKPRPADFHQALIRYYAAKPRGKGSPALI